MTITIGRVVDMNTTSMSYARSRWLDKQYPTWWERLLEWWRGL